MEKSIHLIPTNKRNKVVISWSKRALRSFKDKYDAFICAYEIYRKTGWPLYVHDNTGRVEYCKK